MRAVARGGIMHGNNRCEAHPLQMLPQVYGDIAASPVSMPTSPTRPCASLPSCGTTECHTAARAPMQLTCPSPSPLCPHPCLTQTGTCTQDDAGVAAHCNALPALTRYTSSSTRVPGIPGHHRACVVAALRLLNRPPTIPHTPTPQNHPPFSSHLDGELTTCQRCGLRWRHGGGRRAMGAHAHVDVRCRALCDGLCGRGRAASVRAATHRRI